MKKLSLSFLVVLVLAFGVAISAQAEVITANITTTWYEPHCEINSIFTGSFTYDTTTHAVTNLSGLLNESMYPEYASLSLNNQLPNGDAYHTYTWYDSTLHGTFATVFKNTDSLTFATSVTTTKNGVTTTATSDGWSPLSSMNVGRKYYGYGTGVSYADSVQNAYALIFVPDDLTAGSTTTLAWNESTSTGSLGLAYTSYVDNTEGGAMGSVGMTGTSKYAYGKVGTMGGYPLSEVITAIPEPSTGVLGGIAMTTAFGFRRLRRSKRSA